MNKQQIKQTILIEIEELKTPVTKRFSLLSKLLKTQPYIDYLDEVNFNKKLVAEREALIAQLSVMSDRFALVSYRRLTIY